MAVLKEVAKKKIANTVKERFSGEEQQEKRAVTLFLNRANFEALQKLYGRRCSQIVDELILSLLQESAETKGKK